MRKYINIVLGIVIIALAFWVVNVMVLSNQKIAKTPKKIVKTVFVVNVKNGTVPIVITILPKGLSRRV